MWEKIIKQDIEELLPVLDDLLELLETRIMEMNGVLKETEEEDSVSAKAEYILDMGEFALDNIERAERAVRRIDQEYAKLVDMLR